MHNETYAPLSRIEDSLYRGSGMHFSPPVRTFPMYGLHQSQITHPEHSSTLPPDALLSPAEMAANIMIC